MTTRQKIIDEAERLVDTLKARGETHGQDGTNFVVMAEMLNLVGYRRIPAIAGTDGGEHRLDALDACIIYAASKLARVAAGDRLEPDHYHDTAGYSIIAAAIAATLKKELST